MFVTRFASTSSHIGSRLTVKNALRGFKSLVIAEHAGGALLPGILATVNAAQKIGGDVDILIAGYKLEGTVGKEAAAISGISNVIILENEKISHNVTAEDFSHSVVSSGLLGQYSHILAASSKNGKNFFPRLAALQDSAPLSDVTEVISPDTFKRPMYAGNAIATVTMTDKIKFLLIRPTAFEKAKAEGGTAVVRTQILRDEDVMTSLSSFISENTSKSDRPDLTAARVVVSGGRGMKSAESFSMLETLADKLGGAVGASRAAVDAGYAPNDYQVGQTGKVVAPDLYIAVGISGAIQHLSGMKEAKVIVAVNKDKEAPIFQVSDYGLVGDLFKIIPEINDTISVKS